MRIRRTGKIVIAMVAALLLVFTAACAPSEAELELIEGILQNVDSANGEITIVTKDGRTVTLTIATDAPVETEGATSTLEALEPGASVEVEVDDDGQVATHINARLAKVEGTIIGIGSDNVTVESEHGQTVAVLVTDDTQIKLEDDFFGTSADLHIGMEVEIKFDPESRVAFKIDAEEEEAEIEGIVVEVGSDNVTIETEWGRRLTLVIITNTTRIELEDDSSGTMVDLQVGVEVEVKFDPFTRTAFKIEIEEEDEDEDEETSRLEPIPGVGWGIIEIRVTDPPPADVTSAVVHLSNIEVHRVSGDESGWIPVIGAPPSFDLMVVEEVTAVLGSANVTAGSFTQIRMEVDRVEVVTVDGENFTAEVPSEKLKIVGPFNVGGGTTTVLTLDFDGEKSLIMTGSGKFLFKPVVKLKIEKEKAKGGELSSPQAEVEDTTAPEITVTGVADGQQYTEPVTPAFSVSDDTAQNPTVTAKLNGGPFTSGTEVSEVGEYELVVTAVDASGNEAEVEINFEIVAGEEEEEEEVDEEEEDEEEEEVDEEEEE